MQQRKRLVHVFAIGFVLLVLELCVARRSVLWTILTHQDAARHIHMIHLMPFHSFFVNQVFQGLRFNGQLRDNVVMFVVFGGLYCYYQKRPRPVWAFLCCVCTSLFIETMQFVLKTGTVDVDDVLMNSLGGLVGILLYWLLERAAVRLKVPPKDAAAVVISFLPPLLLDYIFCFYARKEIFWFSAVLAAVHLVLSMTCFVRDFSAWAKLGYGICFLVIFAVFRMAVLQRM